MNDALRKKKNEKKHPTDAEFLKDTSEKKSNIKRYGIVVIVLLVCAVAGYYSYEMWSLSQPMVPVQQSARLAGPRVSPPEDSVSSIQTQEMPPLPETQMTDNRMPAKQTVPSTAPPAKPSSPVPTPVAEKSTLTTASQKTTKSLPSDQVLKAAPPERAVPEPIIEPEKASPRPEPAKKTDPSQTETSVIAGNAEPEPVEELFYRKGLSYHRQNKLEMAIQMYQAVLKNNPRHPSTRFNLASAYIQVGAFTEARTILEELNHQEPGNPDILLNLAVTEIGLDRPQQALAFLDRAEEELKAPTFEILFHKGVVHSRMEDFETALAMYKRAERLAPENPRLLLNTAIVYDSMAQYNQAIDHYQMFLDKNTALTKPEEREITTRIRELKAYLSQDTRPDSGQTE